MEGEREDDAAKGAADGGEACHLAAAAEKPVADGGEGGGEDEGGAEAAEDAKDEQEVHVGGADAEEEVREKEQGRASEDEVAGSEGVEDGADLEAAEE